MAYRELIKSFVRIRDYMRQFYVYGFKSRSEYDAGSARSYDNERRRVESWMGDHMSFRQDSNGKNVFLSVDSRRIAKNPLYKAFKAKSFTDKDITLHFYLLDILADGSAKTAGELVDAMEERYLSGFDGAFSLDESTVRKKLKEYENLGLLCREKQGREVRYSRTDDAAFDLASWADSLDFYAEEAPVGVIGSYLLDKLPEREEAFRFKHHYILHALDSDILCTLLLAISEHRAVELNVRSLRNGDAHIRTVCPLRIYSSTQTGRQYLLAYHYRGKRPAFFRLDAITEVRLEAVEKKFETYLSYHTRFAQNLWGVSTGSNYKLDHIEMTIRFDCEEAYIPQRLEREKRHGTVELLDDHTCRFTADVYDAMELLPWLRTFIGRIVELKCSNQVVVDTFYEDLRQMAALYGGNDHAVQ